MATADRHQLEMAILNLAVNARDAIEGPGELTIAVDAEPVEAANCHGLRPATYVRVRVVDTGSGMDEATRARAIEPFFSTKGVGQGTGLGLSMAHGLASQLGGALTLDSSPGKGTCVTIRLPQIHAGAAHPDPAEPDAETHPHTGLVLLVDDETHIRATIAEMLGEVGLQVLQAKSPEDALSAVRGGLRPNYLITDHLMPGMSGVELARAIKAIIPEVRVLIVSGYAEAHTFDQTFCRLAKPFLLVDLARALADLDASA
jgi:CheY-like chemotaxis protein/anti-sigma regulatory factor (Ser/Thr protein kinase)